MEKLRIHFQIIWLKIKLAISQFMYELFKIKVLIRAAWMQFKEFSAPFPSVGSMAYFYHTVMYDHEIEEGENDERDIEGDPDDFIWSHLVGGDELSDNAVSKRDGKFPTIVWNHHAQPIGFVDPEGRLRYPDSPDTTERSD